MTSSKKKKNKSPLDSQASMKLLRNMSARFDNQIASKKGLTSAIEEETE